MLTLIEIILIYTYRGYVSGFVFLVMTILIGNSTVLRHRMYDVVDKCKTYYTIDTNCFKQPVNVGTFILENNLSYCILSYDVTNAGLLKLGL